MRSLSRISFLLVFLTLRCQADYLDDTGFRALAAELGSGLPDGSGVSVSQIEFGDPAYLPEEGSGAFRGTSAFFSGIAFTAKSGESVVSGHAFAVASHFYSRNTNPNAGRATFTPAIAAADLYRVDPGRTSTSWLAQGWLAPGTFSAPRVETRQVQNHSWISEGSTGEAPADNSRLRRFDFAIVRDGFLAVTGVNNGISDVPALMASAYNNLAVGVSSGGHSTGGTPGWLDGPGRQKPELVAPLDFTSFSTALVSSAGALLRQVAGPQGASATRPETLKAVLLAGATKEEFPGWTRSATAPLDLVFGAGELHVGNSWRILSGLEQAPDQSAARPAFAWSRVTLTPAGTADYRLTVPAGSVGTAHSAVAVWNRMVTDSAPGASFVMSVAPLADYQLALHRLTPGGSAALVDQSLSPVENLEHVYQRQLPSGTYRLRLNLASGSSVPVSLAWRLTVVPHRPGIEIVRTGSVVRLILTGLIPGQSYLIQSSTDSAVWSPEEAFTATETTYIRTTVSTAARRLFRLAATG